MNDLEKFSVIFKEPVCTPDILPAQIEFIPESHLVHVKLEPKIIKEYGHVAGAQGLGSELYFDNGGRLSEIILELQPFDVVDIAPMDLLKPALNQLKKRAEYGHLIKKACNLAPLNPDAVWLLQPFGSAIFSFDGIVVEPIDKFSEKIETMKIIEIGQGIIVALDKDERNLRLVMVEGFQKRQWLEKMMLTEKDLGEETFEILNAIHLKYYEDPEPEEFDDFAANKLAPIISSNEINYEIIAQIKRLVKSYRDFLDYIDAIGH